MSRSGRSAAEIEHLVRARYPLIYVVSWEEGRVVVASADGITDELKLRQIKPKEPPPVIAQRPAPRKPKNLFEALFGFSF